MPTGTRIDTQSHDVGGTKIVTCRYQLPTGKISPYYLDFRDPATRKRVVRKTDATDRRLALERAKAALRAAIEGKWAALDATKCRQDATMADLYRIYLNSDLRRSKQSTAEDVVRTVRASLQALGMDPQRTAATAIGAEYYKRLVRHYSPTGAIDLATRHPAHGGINTRLRKHAQLFARAVLTEYAEAGIVLHVEHMHPPFYLPEQRGKQMADEHTLARFHADLETLATERPELYKTIALARYAGLRRSEIDAARTDWLQRTSTGHTIIAISDRPAENYYHKTGHRYGPRILSDALVARLPTQPGQHLVTPDTPYARKTWTEREPQRWLRQYFPPSLTKMPLHYCRFLHAEDVREQERQWILANESADKAAQHALGHTTSRTTRDHYSA
ncbi:MAG: hypothetical protein AAF555_05600 [Verrucomicrobiota bacterium]